MEEATYNTFYIDEEGILHREISETEFKEEYDDLGGAYPNNGEWEITSDTEEYSVPEGFDLYNPDFSQVKRLPKNHSGKRKK